MPDDNARGHAELRTIIDRAGINLSDADLESVAGAVAGARERLAALRTMITLTEEPAAIFRDPAGQTS